MKDEFHKLYQRRQDALDIFYDADVAWQNVVEMLWKKRDATWVAYLTARQVWNRAEQNTREAYLKRLDLSLDSDDDVYTAADETCRAASLVSDRCLADMNSANQAFHVANREWLDTQPLSLPCPK